MEIDDVKEDLKRLARMAASSAANEDAIVYAVFDMVRRSHVTANMLLLEGRFPELQRCLDLTRMALATATSRVHYFTPHCPDSPAAARLVAHSSPDSRESSPYAVLLAPSCSAPSKDVHHLPSCDTTTGRQMAQLVHERGCFRLSEEDAFLLASLQKRTEQLQKQLEVARRTRPGRDTNYYLNRLLSAEQGDDDAVARPELATTDADLGWAYDREGRKRGQRAATVSPPERGISIGRRTKLNRWKIMHELPPLVTSASAFLGDSAKPSQPVPLLKPSTSVVILTPPLDAPYTQTYPASASHTHALELAALHRNGEACETLSPTRVGDSDGHSGAGAATPDPPRGATVVSEAGHSGSDDEWDRESREKSDEDGAWRTTASSTRSTGRVLHFYNSPATRDLRGGGVTVRVGVPPSLPPPSVPRRRDRGSLTDSWRPLQQSDLASSRRRSATSVSSGDAVHNVPQQLAREKRRRVPLAEQIAAGKRRGVRPPLPPKEGAQGPVPTTRLSALAGSPSWTRDSDFQRSAGGSSSAATFLAEADLVSSHPASDPISRSAHAVQSVDELLRSLGCATTPPVAADPLGSVRFMGVPHEPPPANANVVVVAGATAGVGGAAMGKVTRLAAPQRHGQDTSQRRSSSSLPPTVLGDRATPACGATTSLPSLLPSPSHNLLRQPPPAGAVGVHGTHPQVSAVVGGNECNSSNHSSTAAGIWTGIRPALSLNDEASPSAAFVAADGGSGRAGKPLRQAPPPPPRPPSFSFPLSPTRNDAPHTDTLSPSSSLFVAQTTPNSSSAARHPDGGTAALPRPTKESLLAFEQRDLPSLSDKARASLEQLCASFERDSARTGDEVAVLRAISVAQHSALMPRRVPEASFREDTHAWRRRRGRPHGTRSASGSGCDSGGAEEGSWAGVEVVRGSPSNIRGLACPQLPLSQRRRDGTPPLALKSAPDGILSLDSSGSIMTQSPVLSLGVRPVAAAMPVAPANYMNTAAAASGAVPANFPPLSGVSEKSGNDAPASAAIPLPAKSSPHASDSGILGDAPLIDLPALRHGAGGGGDSLVQTIADEEEVATLDNSITLLDGGVVVVAGGAALPLAKQTEHPLPPFFACAAHSRRVGHGNGVEGDRAGRLSPVAELRARVAHLAAKHKQTSTSEVSHRTGVSAVDALVLAHYEGQVAALVGAAANPFLLPRPHGDRQGGCRVTTQTPASSSATVMLHAASTTTDCSHQCQADTAALGSGEGGNAALLAKAAALVAAREALQPGVPNYYPDPHTRTALTSGGGDTKDDSAGPALLTLCLVAVRLQRWWRGCVALRLTAERRAAVRRSREDELAADRAATRLQCWLRVAMARACLQRAVAQRDREEFRRIAEEEVYAVYIRHQPCQHHRYHHRRGEDGWLRCLGCNSVVREGSWGDSTEVPSMMAMADWTQGVISVSRTHAMSAHSAWSPTSPLGDAKGSGSHNGSNNPRLSEKEGYERTGTSGVTAAAADNNAPATSGAVVGEEGHPAKAKVSNSSVLSITSTETSGGAEGDVAAEQADSVGERSTHGVSHSANPAAAAREESASLVRTAGDGCDHSVDTPTTAEEKEVKGQIAPRGALSPPPALLLSSCLMRRDPTERRKPSTSARVAAADNDSWRWQQQQRPSASSFPSSVSVRSDTSRGSGGGRTAVSLGEGWVARATCRGPRHAQATPPPTFPMRLPFVEDAVANEARVLLRLLTIPTTTAAAAATGSRDALMQDYRATHGDSPASLCLSRRSSLPTEDKAEVEGTAHTRGGEEDETSAALQEALSRAIVRQQRGARATRDAAYAEFLARNEERRAEGDYMTLWERAPAPLPGPPAHPAPSASPDAPPLQRMLSGHVNGPGAEQTEAPHSLPLLLDIRSPAALVIPPPLQESAVLQSRSDTNDARSGPHVKPPPLVSNDGHALSPPHRARTGAGFYRRPLQERRLPPSPSHASPSAPSLAVSLHASPSPKIRSGDGGHYSTRERR